MGVVNTIKIIRLVFPDIRGLDLQKAIQKFNAITTANKQINKEKGQDYRKGYDIGVWLHAQGEKLEGFKELDTIAQELLDGLDHNTLPIDEPASFKEGLADGYIAAYQLEEGNTPASDPEP
jgi:hypothetical protein